MSILDVMRRKAVEAPKNIAVKVESISSGEVVKSFDCGINKSKAEKLESALMQRTDLDKFVVYQSISV